jgi:hypothetical protein
MRRADQLFAASRCRRLQWGGWPLHAQSSGAKRCAFAGSGFAGAAGRGESILTGLTL